ncbi:MAG: MOSC domain-containing protein [Candidatus Zixiibacteriota bacterium]|nr:MAG: MOSC domain-containing protein [candidate division Zixibacteria bacterium]
MGEVIAVCVSKDKGEKKTPVESVLLKKEWGIEGDAHAGNWPRQVSLLASESVKKMEDKGLSLGAGDFAENITTSGIDLLTLKIGTKLTLGDEVELEITQMGKECHDKCAIFEQVGFCVMPEEGVFARVLKGGTVTQGDQIRIVE